MCPDCGCNNFANHWPAEWNEGNARCVECGATFSVVFRDGKMVAIKPREHSDNSPAVPPEDG